MPMPRNAEKITEFSAKLAEIDVPSTHRELNEDTIPGLMDSIRRIGLQTRIVLRNKKVGEGYVLVAGLHRMEAFDRLGFPEIPARSQARRRGR